MDRFVKIDRMTNNQYQEEEKMEGIECFARRTDARKKGQIFTDQHYCRRGFDLWRDLVLVFYHSGVSGCQRAPVVAQPGTPTANVATLMTLGSRDEALGNANAPVTIVEYADYQCPFCTRFFSQIQPAIKSQYIDTGKAKMIFRDFPFLGPESSRQRMPRSARKIKASFGLITTRSIRRKPWMKIRAVVPRMMVFLLGRNFSFGESGRLEHANVHVLS